MSNPRRRLLSLVVVATVAALAVSCGGDEPAAVDDGLSTYATGLARLTDEYRRTFAELSVPDDADGAEVMAGAAVAMWSYISAVTQLEPPPDLVDSHQGYLDAFIDSASYMNDAAATLEGVPIEEMTAVISEEFGSTGATLGANVAEACVALERAVTQAGIGIQLGCEQ